MYGTIMIYLAVDCSAPCRERAGTCWELASAGVTMQCIAVASGGQAGPEACVQTASCHIHIQAVLAQTVVSRIHRAAGDRPAVPDSTRTQRLSRCWRAASGDVMAIAIRRAHELWLSDLPRSLKRAPIACGSYRALSTHSHHRRDHRSAVHRSPLLLPSCTSQTHPHPPIPPSPLPRPSLPPPRLPPSPPSPPASVRTALSVALACWRRC